MSYFWSGYVLKNFIFFNFNTSTIPGFIGVFIALFSLGFLFEALFYLKKHLLQRFLQFQRLKRKVSSVPSSASTAFQPSLEDESPSSLSIPSSDNPRNSLLNGEGDGDGHDTVDIDDDQVTSSSPLPPSIYLLISSMVHALYAFLGYTLMNAVMTFNLWVLVSICTGIGLGYFIFRTEYPHFPSRSPQNPQNQVGIETDDDDVQEEDLTRQPKTENGSRSSSLYKKSPGSPAGSSSRSSSSRRSRNRVRAAQIPGDTESPSENLVKIENGVEPQALLGGGGPPVIVVGAQVHSTYQQSV